MVTNSETGHATNVSNFSKMLVVCTSFGGTYNPSNFVFGGGKFVMCSAQAL